MSFFTSVSDALWRHHGLLLLLGAAFLVVQVYCCARFRSRLRRQTCLLASLSASHSGRRSRGAQNAAEFPWLQWVQANYPADGRGPAGLTRQDALHELDVHLAADGHHRSLQRGGVVAAWLGVLLACVGILPWNAVVGAGTAADGPLALAVPLAAGGAMGALMALFNAGLLHVATNRMDRLRTTARAWFDTAVWQAAERDAQAVRDRTLAALQAMSQTMENAASVFAGSVAHITDSAHRFDQASLGLRHAAQQLESQLQLMPETFRLLKAATEASVNTLHAAGPDLRAAATAFHTAVHTDFVVAAQRHRETIESLVRSAADVRKCTADLATGGAGLRAAVDAQAASFRVLNTSLTAEVLPAHRQFHQRLECLSAEMEKLSSPVAELQRHVAALLGELETTGPQLTPAATGFREASTAFQQAVQDDFAPSVATHRALAEALQTAVTSLTGSMEQFAQGTAVLAGAAQRHDRTAQALERGVREHLTPAQAGLGTAAATLHGAGQELQQQVVSLRESFAAWRAEQGQLLAEWHGIATGMIPAVDTFRDTVGRDFAAAAASHHAAATLLQQSAGQFHTTLQLLNDATGHITQDYLRWKQALGPLGDTLTETLTETTALVRQLQQSVTQDLAPAHTALRTSTDTLQGSTARLAGFAQVLDPVASKLTHLDATLARLADTVAAIQRFAEIRGQLDQLAAALLRVSHVAVAIGSLPEQIRLILKELVDAQRKAAEA